VHDQLQYRTLFATHYHELTRLAEIPHRKLPGSRRCLFVVSDLEQWEAGCELEVAELARGGRIVRPRDRS